MTSFAVVAALLACAVLLCLLPPLLRRDAEDFGARGPGPANLAVLRDQALELDADLAAGALSPDGHAAARDELAGRVLQDVPEPVALTAQPRQLCTAVVLALALPLAAVALYLHLGQPDGLGVAPAGAGTRAPQHDSPADVEAMVAALAARLAREPDDIEGWRMLARSYSAMDRHAEAARTYARLANMLPDEAGVLADYADALATSQGATLKGEPERLVAKALAIDPRHVKALSLSGSAAFQRGEFGLAERQWQAVLALIPGDSDFARSTSASIEAARASRDVAPTAAAADAHSPVGLSGTVRLAPALLAEASPGDAVFIYARAVGATGPPLAALRKQVKDLPIVFRLDDSMGMGGARLSEQREVLVGARISRSGSASPAPGDLEGAEGPVAPGARGVVIEIVQRRR